MLDKHRPGWAQPNRERLHSARSITVQGPNPPSPSMSRVHTICGWCDTDRNCRAARAWAPNLTDPGYDVRCLTAWRQLMARLEFRSGPTCFVLELMAAGDDGLTLLRRLRDGRGRSRAV